VKIKNKYFVYCRYIWTHLHRDMRFGRTVLLGQHSDYPI